MVDVDFAFSKGDWKFDGDGKGDYLEQEYNEEGQIIGQMTTEYVYQINNLKVGDMLQTYVWWFNTKTNQRIEYSRIVKSL